MVIESPRNETVKNIRHLRRSKGDHALLEGPHLVREALAAGLRLDTVLMTAQLRESEAGAGIVTRLDRPPLLVAAELLEKLADADSPRGVLAVAYLPRPGVEALPAPATGCHLYLERLQDPGNLGALARVAEAAGVRSLALSPGSAHPNHPRALRASAGSLLRLPLARDVELGALRRHLQPLVPRWFALAPRGGTGLYQASFGASSVLVLGSEGQGLAAGTESEVDELLTIPLAPPVESLNVTVAAAVALFELRRRASSPPP